MAENSEIQIQIQSPSGSAQTRSVVWNYFEKTNTDTQAKCQLCKDTIKHSNNMSNMIKVSSFTVNYLTKLTVFIQN